MDPGRSEISVGARVAAVAALTIAALVVLIALGGLLTDGGGDSNPGSGGSPTVVEGDGSGGAAAGPATYEIEEGDTLSAISEETGVSVARIEDLNPGLDPQAITPGQEIRLR